MAFLVLLLPLAYLLYRYLTEQQKRDYYYYYYLPEDRYKEEEQKPEVKAEKPSVLVFDFPGVFTFEPPAVYVEEGGVVYAPAPEPEPEPEPVRVEYVQRPEPPPGFERVFRYYDYAVEASRTFNIPVSLILAIIRQESAGNPRAVGSAGEIGLMQVMPTTAFHLRKLGYPCEVYRKEDLFDPKTNIFCGASYLAYLRDRYLGGEYRPWLMAYGYNAGEGNLLKYMRGERVVRRAVDYANRVTNFVSILNRYGIA